MSLEKSKKQNILFYFKLWVGEEQIIFFNFFYFEVICMILSLYVIGSFIFLFSWQKNYKLFQSYKINVTWKVWSEILLLIQQKKKVYTVQSSPFMKYNIRRKSYEKVAKTLSPLNWNSDKMIHFFD